MSNSEIQNKVKARTHLSNQIEEYLNNGLTYSDFWSSKAGICLVGVYGIFDSLKYAIAEQNQLYIDQRFHYLFGEYDGDGKGNNYMKILQLGCTTFEDVKEWHISYFKLGELEGKKYKENPQAYKFEFLKYEIDTSPSVSKENSNEVVNPEDIELSKKVSPKARVMYYKSLEKEGLWEMPKVNKNLTLKNLGIKHGHGTDGSHFRKEFSNMNEDIMRNLKKEHKNQAIELLEKLYDNSKDDRAKQAIDYAKKL